MIILLMGTHLFLTIRLRVPQRKLLTGMRLSATSDRGAKGDVSQFSALAVSLAATIGTGNIIGVGTAIALGGPGAVFWCWLTGVFGMSTKYAESLLAVKYREETANGEMMGGAMLVLEKGLGMKWMGVVFAVLTALATFGVGNTVQSNAMSTVLRDTLGWSPYVVGAVVAVCMALVIMYGVKSIARVCAALLPVMTVCYVLGCLVILAMNASFLGEALSLIVRSALSVESAGGGMFGGGIILAARYGVARGLFSNESGLGSSPIMAASAQTRNPVRQALVSSTATFWDTVVVCALTGLVLVSSILAYPDIDATDGALLAKLAFSKIPYVGSAVLTFAICTFCFSTIIGWYYYGEKAVEYLGGKRVVVWYRLLSVVVCYVGAVVQLSLVWTVADTMNALMAIPNLISLLLLHKVLVKETDEYLWGNKLDDEVG